MKIIIGYCGIVDDALNLGKYVVPPKNYCHNACMITPHSIDYKRPG